MQGFRVLICAWFSLILSFFIAPQSIFNEPLNINWISGKVPSPMKEMDREAWPKQGWGCSTEASYVKNCSSQLQLQSATVGDVSTSIGVSAPPLKNSSYCMIMRNRGTNNTESETKTLGWCILSFHKSNHKEFNLRTPSYCRYKPVLVCRRPTGPKGCPGPGVEQRQVSGSFPPAGLLICCPLALFVEGILGK